ncbi:MFS transporter [Ancylomarina sp. YFZ004]
MRNVLNKEQKSGILLLLSSKALERLAFYLIMAILIQYMTDSLNLELDKAGIYYAIFYGVIGFTSLFSGLLGDLRDRTKIVKIGFILLSVMYLAFIFLPSVSIVTVISIILLGLGVGLISPNITVFLGNIYNEKENEVIGLPGFIFLSIAINIGAFIAPLLSVFLKDNFGYNSIFFVAFVFALISLILFLKFKNQYNKLNLIAEQKTNLGSVTTKKLNTLILVSMFSIAVLIRFALNQKGLTFTFAVRDYLGSSVDLSQTLNSIEVYISIIFLLVFSVIVIRMKKLNWGKIFNLIMIGLGFSIVAFVLIASFTSLSQMIDGKSLFVQSYIFLIIAETLISPAIMYSIYRSSPVKYKGLFQGVTYFVMGITNSLLFLGALLYEKNNSMAFTVFAIMLSIGLVLIIALKRGVNQKLIAIEENGINVDNKS